MKPTEPMRVNKYLAHMAGYSRREADDLVGKGAVTINGKVAVMGAQVQPEDTVTVQGRPIQPEEHYKYVLFYKPIGYVCSRRAQGATPTIYSLLPKNLHELKTVGRLDADSSGLLLLTNDGDFAHRMTFPGFHKTKVYYVELDKPLQPLHQQMISDYGVQLEDGVSSFQVSTVENQGDSVGPSPVFPTAARQDMPAVSIEQGCGVDDEKSDRTTLEVVMHEGRNRQIRRTFAALGYTVTKLHRTTFGPYSLNDLKPGHFEKTTLQ